MKKFLLSLVLATRLFTAFDLTDTRHEFITKVRSDFKAEIYTKTWQLDTEYEAVALLDLARERLSDQTTDWSSVINLVSCGWGFEKGVDTSSKATRTDMIAMRRACSSRALHMRHRGYVHPVKADDVFTLHRSSAIDRHVKAINEASLDEYHIPSQLAVDLVGSGATKFYAASPDFKPNQLNLKYEANKWSLITSDGSWDQVIWTRGAFNTEQFSGSLEDARGVHMFSFTVRNEAVLVKAISTGYMVNVEGKGIAVKIADGDKLGIIESSAYPTADQKNTIRIRGTSYRGGRAALLATRGSINVTAPTISTKYKSKGYVDPRKPKSVYGRFEDFSFLQKKAPPLAFPPAKNLFEWVGDDEGEDAGYETTTRNGGEYKFYPVQEQIMDAAEDINLDGDSVDVSFTALKTGKDLFLGNRGSIRWLRGLTDDPSSHLHTHGSVLAVGNDITIMADKWDGSTLSKYVGDYVQKGNGWRGQDLVSTCDPMAIKFGGKFKYDVGVLAFHDEVERKLMTSGSHGVHDTFETTPLQALIAPPRQQAPQQPQMSKKDMMRALGMGGYGGFFQGGYIGGSVGDGFLALPAMPSVYGAMIGAPTVQSMDFAVGSRGGDFSMSLTSSFKDRRGAYVNTSHPTSLGAPDRMHIVAPTIRGAVHVYKVYKAAKRLKGAKRVVNAARAGSKVPTGDNDEDPDSEDEHRVLSEKDPNFIPNAGGHVKQFVTDKTETYYRVYSDNPVGGFVTKVKPKCSAIAREGLSLPPSNTAKFVQEVVIPAGTKLQRSRALPVKDYGTRGGMEQFEIMQGQNIPLTNFSKGVRLP